MSTMGLWSGGPPLDPKKAAFPNVKMPPSEATSQYEELGGAAGGGDGGPGIPAEPENATTWTPEGARGSGPRGGGGSKCEELGGAAGGGDGGPGIPAEPENATTWTPEGARSRPA